MICRGLSFSYPGSDHPLFSDLDLSISGPGFFSFFGFSGSGKSTLARLISGLLTPESGQISRPGLSICLFSYNTERLPGWMTIREHLAGVTAPGREQLLDELVSEFGIDECLDHKFPRLSMGQKNRVNLARYLVQDFDLLIADEVLANVDEPSRNKILGLIKRYYPKRAFIYISHNAEEVAVFSQKIFVLPQADTKGLDALVTLPGLDASGTRQVAGRALQEKVFEILKASSSRVPWQAEK